MSPYRQSALEAVIPNKRSLLRKCRRKLLLLWKGSFLKRFPFRCPLCQKRAYRKEVNQMWGEYNYFPCGCYDAGFFAKLRTRLDNIEKVHNDVFKKLTDKNW